MPTDENTRLDLRQWFEAKMGPRLAHAMMEAMPPLDYDQLATKADLDMLGRELRADMAGLGSRLRGEMAGLRGEMSEIRGEMSSLRGEMSELRGAMTALEGRLELRIADQTRLLVTMQVMSFGAIVAALLGVAAYLG
jgi:hypothetical protein